jgi:hypothetical protein
MLPRLLLVLAASTTATHVADNLAHILAREIVNKALSSSPLVLSDERRLVHVVKDSFRADTHPLTSHDEVDRILACVEVSKDMTSSKIRHQLRECAEKHRVVVDQKSAEKQSNGCGSEQYFVQTDPQTGSGYCRFCDSDCTSTTIGGCEGGTATQDHICTSCASGYFLLDEDDDGVGECRYCDTDSCTGSSVSCDGSGRSTRNDICTGCMNGYYLVDQDSDGFGYCSDSACHSDCTQSTVTCDGTGVTTSSDACSACAQGHTLHLSDQSSSVGHCHQCDQSCNNCPTSFTDNNYCTGCNDGFYFVPDMNNNVPQSTGDCYRCEDGCDTACPTQVFRNGTNNGANYCLSCVQGYETHTMDDGFVYCDEITPVAVDFLRGIFGVVFGAIGIIFFG